METTYTYEVINVDADSGVMEVVYDSVGNPVQHISMPLPKEGEDLEDTIKEYSPVAFWEDLKIARSEVLVGQSGTIDYSQDSDAEVLDVAELAREERNMLLRETDWWASSDLTMTAEQIAYRQALRDITAQSSFPESIDWPTKP
jgi:hypothetical protein